MSLNISIYLCITLEIHHELMGFVGELNEGTVGVSQ